MYELLIICYLVIALAIVVLVLIQRGKGADMGSSFGAGASATLFGSSGSGNFLTRSTTILGIIFFILSIILANIGSQKKSTHQFDNISETTTEQSQAPVVAPEKTDSTSDIPE
ncbi:preprotein translocase subunit SecG [Orbaceae bacterium ESL0721]|nr:preprotein translocase subunit SecG [Orbaceae bacterium ESL0721]